MRLKTIKYFLFIFSFGIVSSKAHGQEIDSLRLISKNPQKMYYDCEVLQDNRKLKGRRFASVPPMYLQANNEKLTYGVFQLGKRGGQIYLYVNILDDSVCLKDDKNMDIIFSTGKILTLRNRFPINCDGIFAKKLKLHEIQKILQNDIIQIKIYSYTKNYEFYVSPFQDGQLSRHIRCLQNYKMR